jgi:hypothetical protein
VQVPARLGKAACKLYKHAIHGIAAGIATRACLELVVHAARAGVLQDGYSSTGVRPLTLALKQQLVESGLSAQLPLLLTAAAEHLQASSAQHTSSSSGSSSWGILQDICRVQQNATVAQYLFEIFCKLWPPAAAGLELREFDVLFGAICIFPMAKLCVAAG